ncbi:hypothetical protein [Naasia sp. SYSU D00948]|uniref:hypothetical protein n=1 Tax=Naasia sp. SYSU D00948 TaxID=2817379 RepID=UPI001B3150DB|nr:hypothetical protein [Naasia sp. SYSU D00948]
MSTVRARLGAALLLVLVLAGCAAEGQGAAPRPASTPSSSASPAATPSATPSATPASTPAPTPVLDLTCDALLPPVEVARLAGRDLQAVAFAHPEVAGSRGPLGFAVRQAGGLSCSWTNGEPYQLPTGFYWDSSPSNPDYVGITLDVAPEGIGSGSRGTVSPDPAASGRCLDHEPGTCFVNQLFGDLWVRFESAGLAHPDAVRAALDAAAARALDAGRVAPTWQLPAGTADLPDTCDGFLAPEELAGLFGAPAVWSSPAGGWSISAASWDAVGSWPCTVGYATGDEGAGAQLTWLPGGEWAWDAVKPAGDPVPLPDVDQQLVVSCPATFCDADLLLGRTWLRVTIGEQDGREARALAVDVATRIAANLR